MFFFCKNSRLDNLLLKLTDLYVVPVKSKVKIFQNFVAFSEYINFIYLDEKCTFASWLYVTELPNLLFNHFPLRFDRKNCWWRGSWFLILAFFYISCWNMIISIRLFCQITGNSLLTCHLDKFSDNRYIL